MILHTFQGDFQAIRVLAAAKFCGIDLKLNIVKANFLMTSEAKSNMAFPRMPCLQVSDQTGWIVSPPAIIRYFGSLKEGSMGSTPQSEALTEQISETCLNDIEPCVCLLIATILGEVKAEKDAVTAATNQLLAALKIVNDYYLNDRDFIADSQVTLADISLFSVLVNVFRGAISFKKLNGTPKVKAWMERIAAEPSIVQSHGTVRFMDIPMQPPKSN